MDIEEGFSPIEGAATMPYACENGAAFRTPRVDPASYMVCGLSHFTGDQDHAL
jgi:hypothetical protein